MTILQAKELDMVTYLSALGYEPTKISGKNYWYLSPLREEKTASFKVNRHLNRWYDFAEGKGGNLLDFDVQFFNLPVGDFLKKLDGPDISIKLISVSATLQLPHDATNRPINIRSVHDISSYPLLRYLQERRISNEISKKYLREVRYKIGHKNYYALGFKNDAGGYELRNEHFKGSSSPKDVTVIDNGSNNLAVFERLFNFPFYQFELQTTGDAAQFSYSKFDFLFEKRLPILQEHNEVHLYLDNSKAGNKCTLQALSLRRINLKTRVPFMKNITTSMAG